MKTDDLIVTEAKSISVNNENIPVKECFIQSVNDDGVKWVDIYVIVINIKTKEEKKMKIHITGSGFDFYDVSDEEWNKLNDI